MIVRQLRSQPFSNVAQAVGDVRAGLETGRWQQLSHPITFARAQMAAVPTALTRRISAVVVFSGALLAACSSERQESPPPAALETPAMCESRYPPTQPECLVPVILYGASTDQRQACVGEMQAYMQTIGQWRECHLVIVQNDAGLSDHDRNWMIDGANFHADHDLKKAQANTRCLQQGGGCEPY